MLKTIINSSLFRSAGVYTLANAINSAIPFFLLPVFTRYLSPVDYGRYTMFQVLVGFVAPFTGLTIHAAISRQYLEKDNIDLPKYISNCLLVLLASSSFVSAIFWLFSGFISKWSSFPSDWLWAVILVSVGQFITQVILVLWQMQVKPLLYGSYLIFQTAVSVGISIWFVVGLQYGWRGSIAGQLIAAILFSLVGLFTLWKNGWIKFDIERLYIQHALWYGVPLIPHIFGVWVITMTDRVFITNMVGLAEVGVYAVGYQIGMIISLLQNSFNQAWVPWLFERLKQNDPIVKLKIVKFTYFYIAAILFTALLLAYLAPFILKVFVGKDFIKASKFVIWIALGFAFNGMYKMVTNYIFYVGKTYLLAWITLFTAGINVILNYIFISYNGVVGAAQASMVSFFMSFVLTWILSAKVYKMPYNLKVEQSET